MIKINKPRVKEGTGRFINRRSKTAGKEYDRFFIYVPTEVARDSAFPIEEGAEVTIRVEGDKVVMEKRK